MVAAPLELWLKAMPTLVRNKSYLQAFKKNLLLTLKCDISWPSDMSGQITTWLNVTSNIKVSLH